jgi:hypothetical protein
VVGGIRQRGSEAVGMVIIGLARLFLAVIVLLVLVLASTILGFDVTTTIPLAAMSGVSGLLSWLLTRDGRLVIAGRQDETDGEKKT